MTCLNILNNVPTEIANLIKHVLLIVRESINIIEQDNLFPALIRILSYLTMVAYTLKKY